MLLYAIGYIPLRWHKHKERNVLKKRLACNTVIFMGAKIVNICELYGMFLYKNTYNSTYTQQDKFERNYFMTTITLSLQNFQSSAITIIQSPSAKVTISDLAGFIFTPYVFIGLNASAIIRYPKADSFFRAADSTTV